jgi:sulfur carrier protein
VLSTFGFKDAIVATALNGEFVPVGSRAGVQLKDGDRLEVLAPMQGG